MKYKLYTYLKEYILLYPEKVETVTREELEVFIKKKNSTTCQSQQSEK